MSKDEFCSRLGLGDSPSQEEIEARYQEITAFLRSEAVPSSLRRWAEEQEAGIDEAYTVLTGPEESRPRPAEARPGKKRSDYIVVEDLPEEDEEEYFDELDEDEEEERRERQARQRRAAARRRSVSDDDVESADESTRLKQVAVGVAIGLVVLVGFFAIQRGWIPGLGTSASPAATSQDGTVALDQNRVNQLKSQLSKNPDDQDALFELGEMYFQAGMWQENLDYFMKLVQLDPRNTHALTDIGTSNFNLGQYEVAKTYWKKVLEIDPNDVQSHFNMGFLYANVPPQDLSAAVKEWELVAKLAPGSDIAQTAQAHADAYKKMLNPTTASPSASSSSPSAKP
ncbi:MAG: tetratricopeptide repeat protein [Chloroflexota bacterium]|nr:MAG: tetratricopeptide repeat protein [Chloroflexota bacterium]